MNKILLTAGICTAAATIAFAAQDREPGRPGPIRGPIAAAIDSNHDGVISSAEIEGASAALKSLDRNTDGQLTFDELRPEGRPGGPRGEGVAPGPRRGGPDGEAGGRRGGREGRPLGPGGRGPAFGDPIVRALDSDRDGALSTAEMDASASALKTLDVNQDGQLSGDELRPAFGRGGREGRGGPGGRGGRGPDRPADGARDAGAK